VTGEQEVREAPAPAEDLAPVQIDLAGLWGHRFPSPELVQAAAALFPGLPAQDGHAPPGLGRRPGANPLRLADRRRAYLTISPGTIALRLHDPARAERTAERQASHERHRIDQMGLSLAEGRDTPPPRGRIREWSAKSRARMWRTFGELDWTPVVGLGRCPAAVTLTYPGDWLTVAPDSPTCQRHIDLLKRRWLRAWGEPMTGGWKWEFQRRGAPHWALFCAPPTTRAGAHRPSRRPALGDGLPFNRWLSVTWADIVAHPDPEERARHLAAGTNVEWQIGLRASDPRRVAAYFSKHGQFAAKEYQNWPPPEWGETGTGRYWGYLGLDKATATVEVRLPEADRIARTLRRWSRQRHRQGQAPLLREARVPRYRGGHRVETDLPVVGLAGALLAAAYRPRKRRVRRRTVYMRHGPAGFVSVNDGPAMASVLARLIPAELSTGPPEEGSGP
jgi:hypothetical protein